MKPHNWSEDILQNSASQFTEIKIHSFYGLAQQRLKEIWVVKQQPQEQPQESHKQDILQTNLQIDQSIFASNGTGRIPQIILRLWVFNASGTQEAELTKSLDYWQILLLLLSPEIPRDIALILSILKCLQSGQVSWIRCIRIAAT